MTLSDQSNVIPGQQALGGGLCESCGGPLPELKKDGVRNWRGGYRYSRRDRRYCSDACKQRAYRARQQSRNASGRGRYGSDQVGGVMR